jgi:NADH-quinone oxidoreductase subunit N
VAGDYAWLGIVIVIGSMISLAYYLRVIAAMWMQAPEPADRVAIAPPTGQPVLAGGAADPDAPRTQPEAWLVAVLFGAATLFFGIIPSPLFELAVQAGAALTNLV